MCGIAAISRHRRTSIRDARAFARELALELEVRGKDSTGFAWTDDLGHPFYWKSPGPAHEVAQAAPLPVKRRAMLVHTRLATNGTPKDNANNHPHVAPGITLVHNGRIWNHHMIQKLVGVEPETACDTECLPVLLAYGPELLEERPWELLGRVRGSFAIAWLDQDQPHVLHLARGTGSPMHISWTRRGDLVMASTETALIGAAKAAGVNLGKIHSVRQGRYLRVENGRITERHDIELPTTTQPSLPAQFRPGRNYWAWDE